MVLWLMVFLVWNVNANSDRLACTRGLTCHVHKDHLDVFVIGDTGGIALDVGTNFLSMSQPTEIQTKVANSMVKLAEREGLDFIVNVGDNIYWNGVDNVNDDRFKNVFEEPYKNPRLQVPWYMLVGNHDHLGNVDAQIEYTTRSKIWTLPSLFYKTSHSFGQKGSRVEFVFIDTVVLCGNSINVHSRSIFSWMGASAKVPEGPAAKYVDESKKRWKWIEDQLRRSTANHLFVVGHYPIYSVVTKTLQCLKRELDPLMRKYKVGAYFAGHNHNLQYYRDSKQQNRWQMRYVVSGAGSRSGSWGGQKGTEGNVQLLYRFPKHRESAITSELGYGNGGFAQLKIEPNGARLRFYARDLRMEHEDLIPSRR
ncbi:Tartrate-resistant acid phosphatase type 5 [Aphelenchoides besseyi]|nr:Tartrate-resistant acid phosphatase type 5 [Aphelenchoides besseyi]KAI6198554.1 Tartrate-resistant acid phosphatase type 5 [Aphelenchoides besseyi]